MSSLRRQTISGMQWSLLGTIVNGIFHFFVMIVITRLISPEDFGVFAMSLLFLQFAAYFANFGVGTAILRKDVLTDDYISTAFWCGMGASLIIAAIMFFFAPISTVFLKSPKIVPVVRLLAVNFFLNGLEMVSSAMLQREMRFGFITILNAAIYISTYIIIGIPLAWNGYGVYALVICMLAQTLTRSIGKFIATRHTLRFPKSFSTFKEIFSFGGQNSLASFFSFLGNSVDSFVLGRRNGAVLLGIYSRSAQLIKFPVNFFSDAIMRVVFPGFSKIQTDLEKMRAIYKQMQGIMAFFLIPIACLSTFIAKDVISIAYGRSWSDGWPAFVVYAWIAPLSVLYMSGLIINDIIGSQRDHLKIHAIAFLIFAVTIWIGSAYGLKGVAIAVLGGHVYRMCSITVLTRRLLQTDFRNILLIYLWPVAIGILIAIPPIFCSIFIKECNEWVRILLSLCGSALLFTIFVHVIAVPPLGEVIKIAEEFHPFTGRFFKWVKR